MNKRARISLIVLLTTILLVTLVVPGMAEEDNVTLCIPRALTVDAGGNSALTHPVDVVDSDFYWEDSVLINICEGKVPFGESISPGVRFATFDENLEYFCPIPDDDCSISNRGFTLTNTDYDGDVRDPDTMQWSRATFATYALYRNGDFVIYKDNR